MTVIRQFVSTVVIAIVFAYSSLTLADEAATEQDLAKQLSNPIASLVSVPLQMTFDQNIGERDDGDRLSLTIQPVIPVKFNDDWNLISRTILPISHQTDVFEGAGSQTGIGDIVQSVFLSPSEPTENGWIWGAGLAFLLPTGSDDLLTADKWGAGPTAVALKQEGAWTFGALANHLQSFTGDSSREDVSLTLLQPFVAYNTPTGLTYSAQMEATRDWRSKEWTVPLYVSAGNIIRLGGQLIQVSGGVRYYLSSPNSGASGFGLRLSVTLLLPK